MIKRTIVFEQMEDGWVITDGEKTYNIIYQNDEANILYPDGGLRLEHPDDAMAQVLGELEIY